MITERYCQEVLTEYPEYITKEQIYGMMAEHGKMVSRHYEPESEDALRGLTYGGADWNVRQPSDYRLRPCRAGGDYYE